MMRVYRVICGGSTGSWTRSSDDMVSHCDVVRGREEGKEELWSRVNSRPLLPPLSHFWSGQSHNSPVGGLVATARLVMLCRHEILMVEEAKEGCGEEAGSDPPSKEGEEAPEKHGAEDSSQASQRHWQLGYWCPGSCFRHWSWGRGCYWCRPKQRVHFMGARQVFHRIDAPGVSTCDFKKTHQGRKQLEFVGKRDILNWKIIEWFMTHLKFLAAKLYAAASPVVPHTVVRLHTSNKKHVQPG